MLWASAKKALYYAAAAYLALAVIAAFTFMSVDIPYFEEITGRNTAQGILITSQIQPVEYLAINTAKDHTYSPPRQCLPRMLLPASLFNAGSGLLRAAAVFITKTAAYNKKNTILLKLRI